MEVTVYGPQEWEGQKELYRRVARAHARGVVTAIGELSCPEEQKTALLRRVRRLCQDRDRASALEKDGR